MMNSYDLIEDGGCVCAPVKCLLFVITQNILCQNISRELHSILLYFTVSSYVVVLVTAL